MKNFFIVFFIFSQSNFLLFAQSNPTLICADNFSINLDLISWETPPCLPIIIYSSTSPSGSFVPVDTIYSASQLIDTISNSGNKTRWYYLTCESNPTLTSDTLDNLHPEPPVIQYVSVNTSNEVEIHWIPSYSPEIFYYRIFCPSSSTFDTAYGGQSNFFIYKNTRTTPQFHAESFTMDSHDQCNNFGVVAPVIHTTVFLSVTVDSCAQTANLIWTPYKGWKDTITYQVYASVNGNPLAPVSSIIKDTTLLIQNLQDNGNYCFTIYATNSVGFVSYSNNVCSSVNIAKSADFVYIRNATVINDHSIQIDWLVDTTAEINSFEIQRSSDGTNYSVITTINTPSNLHTIFTYNDNAVSASTHSYWYTVGASNCNGKKISSNFGKTILLQGEAEINFINSISWTPYSEWNGGVNYYIIYRNIDTSWQELTRIFTINQNNYSDNVETINSQDGVFKYRVVAVEGVNILNQQYNIDSTKSFSNEIIIQQSSKLFIPNAFVPSGEIDINRIFKPTFIYPDNSGYKLLIYDRWGKMVFQTQKLDEGWNGTIEGQAAEQGVYPYYVEFLPSVGKKIQQHGTVMLIR